MGARTVRRRASAQAVQRLAEENGVTGRRQPEPEEEEGDHENRHEQPRNWPRMPFLLMRVLVWLVTHRVPLMERKRSNPR
jgi:hypothetical protein